MSRSRATRARRKTPSEVAKELGRQGSQVTREEHAEMSRAFSARLSAEPSRLEPAANRVVDEVDSAREALYRLLADFGYGGKKAFEDLRALDSRKVTTALAGLPNDAVAYWERHRRELIAVRRTIDSTLKKVEAYRRMPLACPQKSYTTAHADEWREIVRRWNVSLDKADARTLPRLCENCGTPIFARGTKDSKIATTCSETCQTTRAKQRQRLRKKLEEG